MEVTLETPSVGNRHPVAVDAPVFTIGRAVECDLQLDDPLVSRHHCVLTVEEDTVFVRDLESTNGTGLNDRRLVGAQPLHDRDVIWVAATPITIRIRHDSGVAARISDFAKRLLRPLGTPAAVCSG